MSHKPRDPLLKNEPARNSYGAASSSGGLEAGTGNSPAAELDESAGWFSPSTKQVIAGAGLLLSGGMKIAELIITKSYKTHDPFEPVRGMVILGWILVYMLQLDYVYMIGHKPTDADPAGYAAARALASSKIYKFVSAHLLIALWQFFHIIELPILALVSICLAFLVLLSMYWKLHKVRADKNREASVNSNMTTRSERQNVLTPSFVQGPISSLLIMTATIWMPDAVIDVLLLYHPHTGLRSILWPFAVWLFFVNFIGSHISTRVGYISNKRNAANSAFHAATAEATGGSMNNVAVGTDKRMVPVDLAGVLGLLWVSLAIAAGPGPVNNGPVVVVGYLGAGWQALAIVAAII